MGGSGPEGTHLQFADDMVILCRAKEESMTYVARVLRCFHVMLGLRVNFRKSGLLCIGTSDATSPRLASRMKCDILQLPFKYLGFPMGENMNRIAAWNPLVERVQNRLATWKAVGLAKVGRLVLIKVVPNSMPVYFLSLFRIPKAVINRIEQIQRRFLWVGNREG